MFNKGDKVKIIGGSEDKRYRGCTFEVMQDPYIACDEEVVKLKALGSNRQFDCVYATKHLLLLESGSSMVRLTARDERGHVYLKHERNSEQEVGGKQGTLRGLIASWQRLAAYEDTGLSPEQCAEIARENVPAALDRLVQYESAASLDTLQELVKADEEERLVMLPCKVGTTLYAVGQNEIVQCKVTEVTINEGGIRFIRLYSTDDRIADYRYDSFRKSVFHTLAEAQKVLLKKEDDSDWGDGDDT